MAISFQVPGYYSRALVDDEVPGGWAVASVFGSIYGDALTPNGCAAGSEDIGIFCFPPYPEPNPAPGPCLLDVTIPNGYALTGLMAGFPDRDTVHVYVNPPVGEDCVHGQWAVLTRILPIAPSVVVQTMAQSADGHTVTFTAVPASAFLYQGAVFAAPPHQFSYDAALDIWVGTAGNYTNAVMPNFDHYEWDWGDGSPIETTTTNIVSHTFAPGSGVSTGVICRLYDSFGRVCHLWQPNLRPFADFAWSIDEQNDLKVHFDAGGSFDIDGAITLYSWFFNDRNINDGITPDETTSGQRLFLHDNPFTYTYLNYGVYQVSLIVRDNSPTLNGNDYTAYDWIIKTIELPFTGHSLGAYSDRFANIYVARQIDTPVDVETYGANVNGFLNQHLPGYPVGNITGSQFFHAMQVAVQRGGGYGSREDLQLITGFREPTVYQSGKGGFHYIMAQWMGTLFQQTNAGVWRLLRSNDCGQTWGEADFNATLSGIYYPASFTMALPFGNATDYKRAQASGTWEGGGVATAWKDGNIYFVHSFDNLTWSTPLLIAASAGPASVHQQRTAHSSRLVIIAEEQSYESLTADGAAGSWQPIED